MIFVDYPSRSRLKIFARARILERDEAPELVAGLERPDDEARVERALLLHVEAFDWNCPQHITPRYGEPELRALTAPLERRIAELGAELARMQPKP